MDGTALNDKIEQFMLGVKVGYRVFSRITSADRAARPS